MSAVTPKVRVKIWDGSLNGRDEPEERDIAFGEVYEMRSDQFYAFELVALVAELPQAGAA